MPRRLHPDRSRWIGRAVHTCLGLAWGGGIVHGCRPGYAEVCGLVAVLVAGLVGYLWEYQWQEIVGRRYSRLLGWKDLSPDLWAALTGPMGALVGALVVGIVQ